MAKLYPMNKTLITYGLAGGAIVSILFLGPIAFTPGAYMEPSNMARNEIIGYSIMILSMLSIYFGMRAYKNNYEGNFGFGKALWTGMQINIIANLLFYLCNVLIYEVIAPGFLEEFAEYYKGFMSEMAANEQERAQMLQEYEESRYLWTNSYLYAMVMASTTFFMGIVISLISSMILKQKNA